VPVDFDGLAPGTRSRTSVDGTVTNDGTTGAIPVDATWVQWLTGTPGLMVAFLWGLAEATFFFVVPDVAISLAAGLRPRRAWRHVVAAILGALLGGSLMFAWAARDAVSARSVVAHVPFVRANMFAKVAASYAKRGVGAVFLGPLTGIPYKIYATEAPGFVGRGRFLAATVPARGYRFVTVLIVFGIAGWILRRYLGRTDRQLALWNAVFWVVFYSAYWGRILLR
jgi:hypothetical protein